MFNRSVGNLHGNGVLNEESNMGKYQVSFISLELIYSIQRK